MNKTPGIACVRMARGTVIQIDHVGDVNSQRSGGANMRVDFTFLERGRLSRRQVRQQLQRLVINSIVAAIAKEQPQSSLAKRVHRDARWQARHLAFLPSGDQDGQRAA